MDDIDANKIEELTKEIKDAPKTKKIKWVCPVCSGMALSRQKVLQQETNDLSIEITTELSEMIVTVFKGDIVIEETKFPIKYCPICGRKLKEEYRKLKK